MEANGNGKVRVMVFDVEGSAAMIQAVVGQAVSVLRGETPAAVADAAPAVVPVAALAAPAASAGAGGQGLGARVKQVARRAKPAVKAESAVGTSAPTKNTGVSDTIREQLRAGAKTMAQLMAATGATKEAVYAAAWAMKKRGEIVYDEERAVYRTH